MDNPATFCQKHRVALGLISDILAATRTSAQEGEEILLFMAGMSAGHRMVGINGGDWVKPIAIGWAVAVNDGERE